MIIHEFTNYVGLPTRKMPKPYKDAIKNIIEDLNEFLPILNGKIMKIKITVEIK